MALPDRDSAVGHSFGLEFDGITIKSITEVSGPQDGAGRRRAKENGPDGKYVIKKLPGRPKAPRDHADPRPHRGQELREVGQGQPVRQDGRRPQGRRDHRLRLRGHRGQALQADQRLAEEPGDRLAQGRRHQRPDREAGRSPTSASRSSDAPRVARRVVPDAPSTGRPARSRSRRRGRSRCVTEFAFVLPRGYVDGSGHRAPRRGDAAGHGPRRAGPAARRPGAGEPGVPDGGAAGPGGHPDRHDRRRPRRRHREPVRRRPGLPAGPLPPGQHRGPHPGRRSPARRASTGSPSTSPGGRLGES